MYEKKPKKKPNKQKMTLKLACDTHTIWQCVNHHHEDYTHPNFPQQVPYNVEGRNPSGGCEGGGLCHWWGCGGKVSMIQIAMN